MCGYVNGMTKKRDAPISYRPPESLREEFRARVARSGQSASGYITACVFAEAGPRAARRPPVERQEIARLLAELGALRAQLDDAAGDPALFEAACRDLSEIRAACLLALGMKP